MITLSVTGDKSCPKPFVWSAEDWLKLREEHRIVGTLVGCLAQFPRQEHFPGLPMALLPEEATLLLEKKIVKMARFPSLSRAPGPGVEEEYQKYRKRIFEEQREYFIEERKRQVTSVIDQIIEGKRRKLLGLKTLKKREARKAGKSHSNQESCTVTPEMETMLDKEALLKEEFEKITPINYTSSLVQTFAVYPWLRQEDACHVKWQFPSTPAEKLRYLTFKDIWEKGYYLTSGQKFGSDFLAYPGDPVKFHAQFLVICIEKDCTLTPAQLIAYGRLGTSVRKTVLLASMSPNQNKIIYQSLKWCGAP